MNGYVIFDLDGCISDDRRRRALLPTDPRGESDWDAYHSDLSNDEFVNSDVLLPYVGEHQIVFVTARPEKYRRRTWGWIFSNIGDQGDYALLMRPDNDERPSPELKVALLRKHHIYPEQVVCAYDDRADVLSAYQDYGIKRVEFLVAKSSPPGSVGDVLRSMAETFTERNAVYGDNYKLVAPIIRLLWPSGVPDGLVTAVHWHLFELMVVKLTRFATGGLTHVDSVHDIAVYAAMIEHILASEET